LIANFEIISGQVESPTIGETRTEADFAEHIAKTVEKEAEAAGWWFIVDQLNTHQSESLVKMVAEKEGIAESELGEKGKSGILHSMKSRKAFLENEKHQIRFIYTPKHCSWLNQIEIWFSILSKKLIKWGNFKSKADLQEQLEKFINYFNQTMAKPFKWTFKGFPLRI
jgi:putative transposase